MLSGLVGDRFVSAAVTEVALEEKLELRSVHPVWSGRWGTPARFEVDLVWQGAEFRIFDLATRVPPGWRARTLGGWPERETPAIGLEPGKRIPDKITVEFAPVDWEQVEPGEYYVVILEASSGDIRETFELKARWPDIYLFYFTTIDGRLSTEVTAGSDNHLALILGNTGTAVIRNIDFVSVKPTGWTITFNPDEIESLEVGHARQVEAIIRPPREAIAGDYMITIKAINPNYRPPDLAIRMTVLTPTVWGWVGILIVLAVIAGLGVLFWRLGRR
jgi:uncharacterized membrane protein